MSENSLREAVEDGTVQTMGGLPNIEDLAVKFEAKKFKYFDVEYAENGDDVVYHFWPPNDQTWFLPEQDFELFGTALQGAFQGLLPPDADVRADYTDPRESLALLRLGENPDMEAKPRETYYVRVVGWASNPMSDRFLKNEIFAKLDEAVRATQ